MQQEPNLNPQPSSESATSDSLGTVTQPTGQEKQAAAEQYAEAHPSPPSTPDQQGPAQPLTDQQSEGQSRLPTGQDLEAKIDALMALLESHMQSASQSKEPTEDELEKKEDARVTALLDKHKEKWEKHNEGVQNKASDSIFSSWLRRVRDFLTHALSKLRQTIPPTDSGQKQSKANTDNTSQAKAEKGESTSDYLKNEAVRIAMNYKKTGIAPDAQLEDRNAAIQHMYDTRRDFIENANRYYTIHLASVAAIIYSIKYANDATNGHTKSLLYFSTALLCLLVAAFVYACMRLLRSVYALYSASTVTAAIKSIATGDVSHAWFDSVLTNSYTKPEEEPRYLDQILGVRVPNSKQPCPRESLANRWASNPTSLLAINTSAHKILIGALVLTSCVMLCLASPFNKNHLQASANNASNDLDRRTKSLDESIRVLTERIEPSKRATEDMSKFIEDQKNTARAVSESIRTLTERTESSQKSTEAMSKFIDDQKNTARAVNESIRTLTERTESSQKSTEAVKTLLEKMSSSALSPSTSTQANEAKPK